MCVYIRQEYCPKSLSAQTFVRTEKHNRSTQTCALRATSHSAERSAVQGSTRDEAGCGRPPPHKPAYITKKAHDRASTFGKTLVNSTDERKANVYSMFARHRQVSSHQELAIIEASTFFATRAYSMGFAIGREASVGMGNVLDAEPALSWRFSIKDGCSDVRRHCLHEPAYMIMVLTKRCLIPARE